MKKVSLLLTIFGTIINMNSQNTFPDTGNALIDGEIGATTTTIKGITWHPNSPHYGIYRTIGAWSAPNYQQLQINWATGIILNPTAADGSSTYGKSYVEIQGDGLRVSSGNVGIGTADTKGFKLGVHGKIAAEEVKVALYNNWADFVFEKEYKLPTLKEVESHIKENGHLKDIPSAKEVAKNGIYLGEMNSKLLQKIEELTLYTIQQQKEIIEQKEKVEKQAREIEFLKSLAERLTKVEEQLKKKN
tara:strand:- start:217 stop:954 length:738 start_codon:yes stop_codon:yes gene_type:complete